MYIYLYISLDGPSDAMSHVSYTQLRANLASYLDEVCDSRTPLHITRQNARTVVLMAEEEYEGMMETLHLLRSPANAARLLRSIERADAGELAEHDTAEGPARAEP
jgi:antitoxin YefM